ncbi:hypothetical protein MWU65_17440 [Cellulophaga sp. F20128]|uniref:hypothetical protein n=1 Tax=Cellulophaga sp. F20128 TaxID=2926413 RepID=UPI001FF6D4AC|nr:hypothetical protein [Cellulophaga sp. F20128]MCK0158970.1 hypothetical protein [Cellulophaga sp. F20128]
MKFKNIEEAKDSLVEAILCEYIGTLTNNDKLQEKSIKTAFKIDKYIKNNFDLRELKGLLNYDVASVQVWVANMLLPIYEDIALKLLKDIRNKKIPHCSYNAGMIIDYWKK